MRLAKLLNAGIDILKMNEVKMKLWYLRSY
jgi:hypothetical protein